jgi:hypothetical protein
MMKAFALIVLWAACALGQISIVDTLKVAQENSTWNGTVTIVSQDETWNSASYARWSRDYTITAGAINITLIPGVGTYRATFRSSTGRETWTETWRVATATSPQKLTDVRVTLPGQTGTPATAHVRGLFSASAPVVYTPSLGRFSCPTCAAEPATDYFVNVQSYGAVGDGLADDTAEVALALAAVQAAIQSKATTGDEAVTSATMPVLYFPAGRYKLSGGLVASSFLKVVGDHAILEQTAAVTTLTINDGNWVHISGITFWGGTGGIAYKNRNLDGAMFTVEDCDFREINGWPILAAPLDGFDPDDYRVNHLSTRVEVNRSRFMYTPRAVKSYADWTIVSNCWATFGGPFVADNTAFFENHGEWDYSGGRLILDNFLGVPVLADHTQVRWIDNYGSVTVKRSRFGGEWGGIPIIYNYASYRNTYPYTGHSIVIRDSDVWAGTGRSDGGLVVLKTALPGMVMLEGNQGPVSVPYINNVGIADLAAYLAAITYPEYSLRFVLGHGIIATQPDPTSAPGTPPLYPALLAPWVYASYGNPIVFPKAIKAASYWGAAVPLTRSGGRIRIDPTLGNLFTWTQADNSQTIVSFTATAGQTPTGQVITLKVSTATAASPLTNPSFSDPGFNDGPFKLVSIFTPPPNGETRTISFVFDGTSWIETGRSMPGVIGTGTVTSVEMTVPSGFSVSGSPVTGAGTLGITTTLAGALKGTGTGFAAVTGSASDCVRVDGSSGPCAATTPYSLSFSAATTNTVAAATHGQGTTPRDGGCYQTSDGVKVEPNSWARNGSGDVTVTFTTAFTGSCVIF